MLEYRFKPISKTCAGTGAPLQPGSVCYSVLVEQHGGFERRDYSEAGWQGMPEGVIGFWQCIVPRPEARRASSADPERLLQFLEQLLETPNSRNEKLAYVLALSLLQRRRLKLDGSRVDGDQQYLELSGTRGEGPYEVRDQPMSQEEIAELRTALDEQLSAEWEAA